MGGVRSLAEIKAGSAAALSTWLSQRGFLRLHREVCEGARARDAPVSLLAAHNPVHSLPLVVPGEADTPKHLSAMASGNNSDPPRAHGRQGSNGRRLSQELNSDQVAEETEEVFRSYAFYRYQQEREERGEEMPMDPEIAEIQQELGSTGSLVGRRLAIIGDDINERYDAEFRYMLKSLQPTKENAYEYFTRIASSLFESGINWGRVIALLGFGYRMAIHVYQHGIPGFLRRIARYVAEFMLRNRIAQWIAQQGGWVAALELDNVYMKYMLVVVALVMVGHLVVRRFFRP
ncbi:bcl-2 homologous antagonist/killer isoform X2 [Athene cunicularia]|uniref:bcl-2 homologous antagonist/killer isoform X2 n=1 Tax=Athene cunicularia TaxID=194338 RepID=UPI000EF724EC|nr:bcl-2 homologous antagonist/killer isoform X2 [Athene cunicularia]